MSSSGVEFDETLLEGEACTFDHSSAIGKWGPIFLELTELHDLTPELEARFYTGTGGAGGSNIAFDGATKVTGTFLLTNGDGDDQFAATGANFEVVGATTINNGLGSGTTTSAINFSATTNKLTGGLTVAAQDMPSLFGMYYPPGPNRRGGILLNSTMGEATIRHTASHELGHAELGHERCLAEGLDPFSTVPAKICTSSG